MANPVPVESLPFAESKELADWLSANHAIKRELWVRLYKKNSGIQSISWDELVIECLCWGWIDGVKKSLDDKAYLQRITPRKPRSNWSKRNTLHVERLIKDGRITKHGLVHVNAAKADGRWEEAYVASEIDVPTDFMEALEEDLRAKQFYETLTKSSRFVIAYGLTSAKKTETRQRRFAKYMTMLAQQEKPK